MAAPENRRIWVIAKGYAPDEGGMQTYAQGVAEAWAQTGADVVVFSPTSLGPRRLSMGGVTLVDIGAGKSPLVPLRFLRAMRKERTAAGEPAFVHGTTWRTALLPMVSKLPYLVTFHGREFMYGGGVTLRLMRAIARRAKVVVAVSHFTKQRLTERLGPDLSPVVAWNGLSPSLGSHASGTPDDGPPLLFSLCRLEPRKNIAACVRACAALHREGLSFRYVIGGRGPELGQISSLVAELGLEKVVEVAGFMDGVRVAELHRQADVFLHPQIDVDDGRDFEGFGITIADAMAAETAVIVGASGGTPELIQPGTTGLVIDGRDDAQLTSALRTLLVDSEARRAMARAARDYAGRTFRWDRHVALITEAFSA